MKRSHALLTHGAVVRPERQEIRLVEGDVWSCRPGADRSCLRVLEGEAYVTQEGEIRDHFLHAGAILHLTPGRLTVVQGFPDTCVTVEG